MIFQRFMISFLLVLGFSLSYGQKPLYEKVMTWQAVHQPEEIRPFHTIEARDNNLISEDVVTGFTLFQPNPQILQKIEAQKPEFIRLEVPAGPDANVHLLMVLEDVTTSSFSAVTNDPENEPIDFKAGAHYRGIIEGQTGSFAAMSFFEDDVIGVFSGENTGNQVIGKLQDSDMYISYNDAKVKNPPMMECWNAYLYDRMPVQESIDKDQGLALAEAEPCKEIKIYVEADYLMYLEKGRSKSRVIKDVNGMFNVVAALYENEGINVKVNKIVVWTSRDPYNTQNSFQAILGFGNRVKDNFDGDLGHLLSRSPNNLGGVGWIDKLCDRYNPGTKRGRVAYSNIGQGYRKLPTYSWSVNVLTHEMGHNLGSYHTHSCRWNGNRTQIDDCGNVFASNTGQTPEGTGCYDKNNPIIPSKGGTIMSYCHLNSVGVRFSNGFGQQPGDVIRGKVARAFCLGGAFDVEAFPKGQVDLYFGDSIQLRSIPSSSSYTRQWYLNDEPIPGANRSTIKIGTPGDYSVEVIKDCSVFSNVINVLGKEYIASINFPVVKGDSGTLEFEKKLSLPSQKRDTLILDIPEDVLQSLQQDLLNWDIQLKTYVKYGRPGDISILQMGIFGPMGSGIEIPDYNPTADEKPTTRSGRYYKYFDMLDPGGIWKFPLYNPNDSNSVSRKMTITVTLTLRWKAKSRPSEQNIIQCDDPQSVTLDPQLAGDHYRWNTGDTTATITVTDPGEYSVTVTKGRLSATDDIRVTFRPEDIYKDTTLCKGEILHFGKLAIDSSGDYSQSLPDSGTCDKVVHLHVEFLSPTASSQAVSLCYGMSFLGEKRYENDTLYEVLPASNGCDSTISYYLNVKPEIKASIRFDTGCYNAPTKLFVTTPKGRHYSYEWPEGILGDSIVELMGDSVSLIIRSGDCETVLPISVPHYPAVGFALQIEDLACYGDSSGRIYIEKILGDGPFTYFIDGVKKTVSTASAIPLLAGDHRIYSVDTHGCQSEEQNFEIVEPDSIRISATLKGEHPGREDGSIELQVEGGTAPYKYVWSNGAHSSLIDHLSKGNYEVKITDANDCTKIRNFEVQEIVANITPDIFKEIRIFPNPAKTYFNIRLQLTQPQDVRLRLYDTKGTSHDLQSVSRRGSYDMKWYTEPLPNGIYYLEISSTKGVTTRKIYIAK